METDVNKCAKVYDIAYRTAELIPDLKIGELQYIAAQDCAFKLITVVPSRCTDRIFNVLECIRINAEIPDLFFRELGIGSTDGGDPAGFH